LRHHAETALLQLRKVRWAHDFGDVAARVAWERGTRAAAAAALEAKTLRAALPDTRWPLVQLKLQVEVNEPPAVAAARQLKAQQAAAARAQAAFGEAAVAGLRSQKARAEAEAARAAARAAAAAQVAADEAAALATPAGAAAATEAAAAAGLKAAAAMKKGSGWALLKKVQGVVTAAGRVGKTAKAQGRTADQYGWRVKLTLNIEIGDEVAVSGATDARHGGGRAGSCARGGVCV
jgi:hypothetical protein